MSNGFGFLTPSLWGFIKQVRHLLNDQYPWDGDGLTIVKELVQNANDAGATSLDLGLSLSGLGATAKHPLLNGPALFVINNGRFKPQDAENIARLGTNSKAGDASTVGKFGLGLKSIFHLCETFFYLSSDLPPSVTAGDPSEHNRRPRCSVFNPWSPPLGSSGAVGPHENWDQFSDSDQELIRAAISGLVAPLNEWIALWIPLRQTSSLGGKSPIVPQFFDGAGQVESLFPTGLSARISEMLPLLHTLKHVRCWKRTIQGELLPADEASVTDGASRPTRLSDGDRTPKSSREDVIQGTITVGSVNQTEQRPLRFAGKVNLLVDAELTRLQDDPAWPADSYIDEVTLEERETKEKALPHCAVRFLELPSLDFKRPTLSVRWAVFLPLSDEVEHETVAIPRLGCSVSLHLHGYFFVDAGRQRVKRVAHDDKVDQVTKIRAAWNHRLKEVGTLPLVIPALDAFIQEAQFTVEQTRLLTKAITGTQLWKDQDHQKQICADYQWGFIVEKNAASDGLIGRWQMFDAKCQVLCLPEAPKEKSLNLPLQVFPNLFKTLTVAGEEFRLTFRDEPRLTAPSVVKVSHSKYWPPKLAASLVTSVNLESLIADVDGCQYLLQFLEDCGGELRDDECCRELRDALANWIGASLQTLFAKISLEDLNERSGLLQRLVAFSPPGKRVSASWAECEQTGAHEVFAAIASMNLTVLVIPQICEPAGDPCTGKLPAGDCESILDWLGAWEQKPTIETKEFAKFVEWVFQKVEPKSRDRVIGSTAAVIKATKYARDTIDCWVSPRDVIKQDSDRNEFKFCDNVFADAENGGALSELSAAFVDWPILNLVPELALAVFPNQTPSKYCIKEVVRVVNQCEALLSASDQRLAVLERLKTRDRIEGNSDKAKAIRYLLHGNKSHRDDDMPAKLIRTETGNNDDVWPKLATWTMEKTDSRWRLLAPDIAERVETLFPVPDQRVGLGIVSLDHVIVTDLLRGIADVSDFPSDIIDKDKSAYGKLLDKVSKSDDDLLRRLPIHRRQSDGMRVAITENKSYWTPDRKLDDALVFKLDDDLANKIELLSAEGGDGRRQRRESLTKTLSRQTAIEISLSQQNPSLHCRTILNALSGLNKDDIADELRSALRSGRDQTSQPWVPTAFGPRWPAQIVNLPEVDVELCQLREVIKGEIVFNSDIEESVRTPSAIAKLCELELLPDRLQSLDLLKPWMAASSDCRTGITSKEAFAVWIELPWPADVMPAYAVLKSVWDLKSDGKLWGKEACYQHLAEALGEPVAPFERAIKAIKFLEKEVPQPQKKREIIKACFLPYVIQAIKDKEDGSQETLSAIRLPSASGEWRSPANLTEPKPGSAISLGDQVDEEVWKQLKNLCRSKGHSEEPQPLLADTSAEAGIQTFEERFEETAEVLEKYFHGWDAFVPAPIIGGFLALLGNHSRVRELARKYLGRRTIEFVQEIALQSRPFPPGSQLTPDNLRVEVVIERGEKVEVDSLLGTRFLAGKGSSDNVTNLLVEKPSTPPSPPGCWMKIVRLAPPPRLSHELRNCLLNTTTEFLSGAYFWKREQIKDSVAKLFDALEKDHCDVSLAQETFLDNAELLLRLLNCSKIPTINEIHQELQRVRITKYENRQRKQLGTAFDDLDSEKTFHEAKKKLRAIFQSPDHATIHDQVLAAVRRKIKDDNRYEAKSVPFEIFQNADDAAVDRVEHFDDRPEVFSFDVFEEGDCLAFRHFGRCVNQVPSSPDENNPHQAMADDLSGMLTPWLSTKGEANQSNEDEPHHTGKFGLGFKCVFLISKTPKLLSGGLACEIVGGIYPVHIPAIPDSERLGIFGSYLRDEPPRPLTTILKLPLDVGPKSSEVLRDFQKLAHIQVIFGRVIRRIRFFGSTDSITLNWEPQPLFKGCLHGALPNSLDTSIRHPARAILLQAFQDEQSDDRGELLLAYDKEDGFNGLDGDVPTIWVTAPVRGMKLNLGFAINSDFELDPGRSNLAPECPENRRRAERLGLGFGKLLADLFKRTELNCQESELPNRQEIAEVKWQEFRCELQLAPEVQPYRFWCSLWKLLTEQVANLPNDEGHTADRLVRRILWDEESGMATHFYRDHAALPNGLPDGFQNLGKASESLFELTGVLLDQDVLSAVAQWGGFRQHGLSAKNMVADHFVGDRLRRLAPDLMTSRVDRLALANLIQWEAVITNKATDRTEHNRLIESLGQLLTFDFFNSKRLENEKRRLLECCRDFRFFSEDDSIGIQPASELVVSSASDSGIEEDERLRAAVAPRRCRLNSGYSARAIEFFVLCRGGLKANSETMAKWAVEREIDSDQRQGVLRYLLEGQLHIQLGQQLRDRRAKTWLEPLDQCQEFMALKPDERGVVKWLLGIEQPAELFPSPTPLPPSPPPSPATDPKADLEEIYNWWIKNREKQLAIYERKVFPIGIERSTLVDADLNRLESRKHWMTLFMLGISHTMGAFRFAQHRDFIQLCNNKGILDQLADRSLPPGAWHQKVLDYVDSGTGSGDTIEYFHWLKQMVGASVICRWLDVYRRTFLATNKNIPFGFSLQDITCPRSSSHFRGAGPAFSAPPLRQVLGMGACFVMRELARREIIQNRQAFRFCFVPHLRTCVLLSQIGCSDLRTKDRGLQSQRIFEFLCKHLGEERATFHGAFDIPFLMLEYFGKSKRSGRHQRLFKRQIDTKDWPTTSTDEGWRTLPDGRRIKLW